MNIIAACVRNPVKVSVGVLLVVLFGIISLWRMPMQLTPEVVIPTITIETRWPGGSPQEVEREIVQAQEEQLKGIEGVTKMTSECMDSMGRVTLEFLVGTDMSQALLKVNSRLQQVRQYPEDSDEPVISTSSSSDTPIAWFILEPRMPSPDELGAFRREHPDLEQALGPVVRAHSTGLALQRLRNLVGKHPALAELLPPAVDVPTMRRFAEDVIEASFERVPGVANANVFGGRDEEIHVVVDPQRLASRRITITQLRLALQLQNKDTSGGDFQEGKRRYVVRTLGQFRSPEEVADMVVARRDGDPVYVRDVAQVELTYQKATAVVQSFGETCIAINCQRESGANVLEIMDGLRQVVAELNAEVVNRKGLQLKQVYDETEYIESAVGLVTQNIIVGGCLTIVVLLLFLRSARSTLVIVLAIPTSLIGTFLILGLLGRSLNVVSLAGMAFAVGMLVDNAVVVLENIYRHYEQGDSAPEAAVRGASEVWGAVIASSLTTLAVFLPVLFVQDQAGQLFRDIALAISGAVGLSLLVSVTVIPTAAARLLAAQKRVDRTGTLRAGAARFVRHVVGVNAWLQGGVLRRLVLVLVLVSGAFAGLYLLLPKVEYLPTGNRNLVFAILLPPPGYNLDELVAMGQRIESDLQPYWDVDPEDPATEELPFPAIEDFFFVATGRQVFLGLRTMDPLRCGEIIPLVYRVAGGIPGTFAVVKQSSLFERGLTAGRTVDIEISGPELPHLVALGGRIMGQVPAVLPGATAFPRPSLDLSSPELHIVPRWEQAADLGITARDLGYTVDALVDGAYATDYFIGGDKIDLRIVGEANSDYRTQDIGALPVATPAGRLVPLSAVATITLGSGPEQINHRERQRTITIGVSPPADIALEDAMSRIQNQIVQPLVQEGVVSGLNRIYLAGTADKLRATWLSLRFNVVLALLITYLLMAALFESWIYPLVIILSVPLGAVGGMAALRLLNVFVSQPLDVLTMLGFVILIGTVVNNAILIVHKSLTVMRHEGLSHREAVLAAVRTRIRPIFMTTFTTVFGLMPLVLFPGAGSELYRGLGSVVLGGLLVSTFFTLVLVPTLFSLVLDARKRLSSLRG